MSRGWREKRRIKKAFLREVAEGKPPVILPDLEVQRLRLEPGDILVVTSPQHLNVDAMHRIAANLERGFGGLSRIAILDAGMKLTVLNESELA